jgi:hypothetical protein
MMMDKPKKYLALFLMVPTSASVEREEEMRKRVEDTAYEVDCFLRYYEPRNWDVQCRGFIIRYDGYVDYPAYAQPKIESWWEENGDPDWQYTHYLAWGNLTNIESACGQAILGGNRGMVNGVRSQCGKGTIAHEYGHQFGMYHSGVVREDGRITEYGDDTDIMGGAGTSFIGFTSWHMLQLDMDTLRERYEVTDTCELLIRPIELPWHCLHEDEYQHVIIGDITLSIRKVRGCKFPVKGKYEGRLFIHEKDPDFQVKKLMPEMLVGDVRTLRNGYTVHYHDYENETAHISVVWIGDEVPKERDIPTQFPTSIVSAYVHPHHTNAWYNKAFTGQGLDLHVNSAGDMAMYWYTAGPDGKLTFYSGAVDAIDANKQFPILAFSGGTWDDPSSYTYKQIGIGKLEFFDCSNGVFHYNFHGVYDNGAMEIVPVARSVEHPMSGIWYQPGKYTGSGFSTQVFANERMAMYWYTYDKEGHPVWFSCEGIPTSPDLDQYMLTIYEVRNLEWRYFSKVEFAPVGTATAELVDGKIRFSYHIDTTWVTDSGEFLLTKLF